MSLLEVRGLCCGYGGVDVLHDIDLTVEEGELVSVIGANGAGKTTLLQTLSAIVKPSRGTIRFGGEDVTRASAAKVAALGIGHVPENRQIFPLHPVEENLRLGGWVRRRDAAGLRDDLARVYEKFPVLGERRRTPAGLLSGGQQQMLAIGMALMARPRLILLDEPSLGLAPILVEEIFAEVQRLREEGATVLLVEQMAGDALRIADRGLVLQLGHVVVEGSADELRGNDEVVAAYLG
ncbi:MAG: ABC transporter ATP-binding protein [Acidimicrobiia bacterium]